MFGAGTYYTINNLNEQGVTVEQIAADAGYSSSSALQACVDNNITAYISNFGQYKPFREGFTYNKEEDYCRCGTRKCLSA